MSKIKKGIKLHGRRELLKELNQIREEVNNEKGKGCVLTLLVPISLITLSYFIV